MKRTQETWSGVELSFGVVISPNEEGGKPQYGVVLGIKNVEDGREVAILMDRDDAISSAMSMIRVAHHAWATQTHIHTIRELPSGGGLSLADFQRVMDDPKTEVVMANHFLVQLGAVNVEWVRPQEEEDENDQGVPGHVPHSRQHDLPTDEEAADSG